MPTFGRSGGAPIGGVGDVLMYALLFAVAGCGGVGAPNISSFMLAAVRGEDPLPGRGGSSSNNITATAATNWDDGVVAGIAYDLWFAVEQAAVEQNHDNFRLGISI